MRNQHNWQPTRLIVKDGQLSVSRDHRKAGRSSRLVSALYLPHYNRCIPKYCRGRLLDLGCGAVPFYGLYREYVDDNICVDWENSQHDNQFVDVACDLTKPLPLEDVSFDAIILSSVLEHIPNPAELWHEMSRVLKPGGHLLLGVPFMYWLHEVPHDYYRYTEFALRRFAENSQLEIVELEAVGGAPFVVADVGAKALASVPWIGNLAASMIQGTCAFATRVPPIRSFCERTRARFPNGYFLVARKA